jgi:hypothetical protein
MTDIEQLVEALAAQAEQVRPAPHPFALAAKLAAAAALYLALALAASGLRPDFAQAWHHPWYAAELLALLLLFLASTCSVALLGFPDLHQKRALAYAPPGLFALFALLLAFAWQADTPPAPLPVHSWQCSLSIMLVALLPAAWTFYALRRYASTHFRLAGSIALLSAFSVGALWLRLHEVNDSIYHVVLWHYLPMLAAGFIGLWLGNKLLRW